MHHIGPACADSQSADGASPSQVVPPDAPSTPVRNPRLGSNIKEGTSPFVDSLSTWHSGAQSETAESSRPSEKSVLGTNLLQSSRFGVIHVRCAPLSGLLFFQRENREFP